MRGCIKSFLEVQDKCVNLSAIIQDFSPVIYNSDQLSFTAVPLWECMLSIWQKFMFVQMCHDIKTVNLLKLYPLFALAGCLGSRTNSLSRAGYQSIFSIRIDICIDTKWSIIDITFDIFSNLKLPFRSLILIDLIMISRLWCIVASIGLHVVANSHFTIFHTRGCVTHSGYTQRVDCQQQLGVRVYYRHSCQLQKTLMGVIFAEPSMKRGRYRLNWQTLVEMQNYQITLVEMQKYQINYLKTLIFNLFSLSSKLCYASASHSSLACA